MGNSIYSCPIGYTMVEDKVYRSTVHLCIQKQVLTINGLPTNYTFISDIANAIEGSSQQEQSNPNTFVLGIGLGFGIPVLFLLLCVIARLCYEYRDRRHKKEFYNCSRYQITPLQANNHINIEMPLETAERELTPQALQDFRAGRMTFELQQELMILRIKKRQDLKSYVRYADICEQPQLADWIARLNPGVIPREVRELATRQVS